MEFISLRSLLAASIAYVIYAPNVLAEAPSSTNNNLPVLEETETQTIEQENGLLLNREEIKATPVANNNLSQLLKTQPGIAINDARASVRGGDIKPEEISLANARTHQTNYMIGGVTTNNISTFAAADKAGGLGGHTSGYFFDTELLESVEVMDRNISPEYGSFTGGIINAELRKPTDTFVAEYSYKMNKSSWNSDPTLDADNKDLQRPGWGDGRYQDQYEKRFHNLFIGGPVSELHKLGFGLSVQESDIPLIYNGGRKNQQQTNTSAFINHLGQLGAWEVSNELRYSKFTEKRFLNDTFTDDTDEFSDYKNSHGGFGYTLKLNREFTLGAWRNTVAFDQLKDERKADVDYFKTHLDLRNGFDLSSSGSYGNLDQTQNSTKLKSAYYFNALYTASVRHQVTIGSEATLHSAEGQYHEAFNNFSQSSNANGSVNLNPWVVTEAGNYKAESNQYALYVSDTLQWNKLTLNLGLRAEHIELFDDNTVAPRFHGSWDFQTDRINRLSLGASRYYSGSLLGWALASQRRGLQTDYRNCIGTGGGNDISLNPGDYDCGSVTRYQTIDLNQAKTPYSDELTVDYDLQLGNVEINAGFLRRQQRNGLSFVYNPKLDRDQLHNNMESDSDIYSLRFSNIDNYQLLGADIGGYLKLVYTDATGSGSTTSVYDDQNDLNSGSEIEWVELDGQLMRRSEMDTGSYNSDLAAVFALNATLEDYGLTLSNLVRYEAGRDLTLLKGQEIRDINGKPTAVSLLSKEKLGSLVTWDAKLAWTPPVADNLLTLGLTVTNLLNRQVKVSTSGIANSSKFTNNYYSKGREVWLSVGMRL
ncbi:outer membrane beta-barrel protein [Endozoicomonas euniceicola]|uniref:TonB-dependent receptor plug domain-containing protein n=1 Tax=Endozoicomonas euniceicola TaxID=1234143 RepID=A0ABY6GP16_9GAMM|nr:outer membrane beta-barrel protein [Endozoicomonas euniceicola]UYM14481.1 TonB-dependent receptor plug domain-containing protein [Endozoicomonas euniceicola]